MPYTRPYANGFVDYPDTSTPMTAAVMNTMDLGIKAANDQIQTLTTAQRTALTPNLGQIVWDSTLNELFVYLNGAAGNAWFGIGNCVICTSTTRPNTPVVGQVIYQTDTDEVLKYVTYGSSNRWMKTEIRPNRNAIINGGFSVDQRNNGSSHTITAGAALAYTLDRWYAYCTGASIIGNRGSTRLPFSNYYRLNGAVGNTAVGIGTRLEASNTMYLAGTTATLSAWMSSTSLTSVTWTAYYANTTDSFGTLASPTRTQIATGTWSITSTFSYQTAVISIPSAATTGIEIVFTAGALTSSNLFDIGGVQLEQGSAPSVFEFRDFGEELRRCQRYYYRMGPYSADTQRFGTGFTQNTSAAYAYITFPTKMRTAPTAVETSGTATDYGVANLVTVTACNATPGLNRASADGANVTFFTAATLVGGQGCQGVNNSTTTAYLGFSAEL